VSSELHTVQAKVPRYVKIAGLLVVLIPVAAIGAVQYLRHQGKKPDDKAAVTAPKSDGSGTDALFGKSDGSDKKKATVTPDEWVHDQLPRVAGIPWSAPIFDGQKVETQPDLFCAKFDSDDGLKHDNCTCLTEQGTRAQVPHAMCLAFAEGGVYNPYRKPLDARRTTSDSSMEQSPAVAHGEPSMGAGAGSPTETNHGERDTSKAYTPPEYGKWNPDPFGSAPSSR
jgi:zona occludens toxin